MSSSSSSTGSLNNITPNNSTDKGTAPAHAPGPARALQQQQQPASSTTTIHPQQHKQQHEASNENNDVAVEDKMWLQKLQVQNRLDQPDVDESHGDRRECGAQHREMGEQQECQDKLEQKALQHTRAHKVHVVSMHNSDPSVYQKVMHLLHIFCSGTINTQEAQAQPCNLLKGYRQDR
ncbi:uncharacterized protein LOC134187969 [Corticium candelabrum]|uniref:uncharacterized protein LOC134187969 n=1 Tax=Corticium candelabrum TaxID=121492 RepID=UPI002E26E8EC|nr:uncharacterized protein LOC134187969 [Corticium candelabrum]